jgi:hypothetical protein
MKSLKKEIKDMQMALKTGLKVGEYVAVTKEELKEAEECFDEFIKRCGKKIHL